MLHSKKMSVTPSSCSLQKGQSGKLDLPNIKSFYLKKEYWEFYIGMNKNNNLKLLYVEEGKFFSNLN